MLRKYKVSNFKSFEKDFELDLTNVNGYEFNKNSIKDGVVNNAIMFHIPSLIRGCLLLLVGNDNMKRNSNKQRRQEK